MHSLYLCGVSTQFIYVFIALDMLKSEEMFVVCSSSLFTTSLPPIWPRIRVFRLSVMSVKPLYSQLYKNGNASGKGDQGQVTLRHGLRCLNQLDDNILITETPMKRCVPRIIIMPLHMIIYKTLHFPVLYYIFIVCKYFYIIILTV